MAQAISATAAAGPRPSQAQYGSDYIVELLRALDIEYAAFNPGATFRGLHDSLVNFGDTSRPEIVQVCHEEVSVDIAHGYAKATGKPMAAIVHDVVGLQHASMAIFNAWVDRVPVLVLGGTGPMDTTRRRPWIDWIHTALVQGNLVRDFTKFDDQPATIAAVPESLLRAYRTMMMEPQGPVYVCFDADVQEQPVKEELLIPDVSQYVKTTRLQADPAALAQAADWLAAARQPLIYAAWLGRHPEAVPALVELAEMLAAPVISSEDRLSFPTNHPLNLNGAERELVAEADLILALDAWDLHAPFSSLDRATRKLVSLKRPDARLVQISLGDLIVRSWTHDFQGLYPTDLFILGDTSLAVPSLVELVRERLPGDTMSVSIRQARREHLAEKHRSLRAQWWVQADSSRAESPVSLAHMAAEVWRVIQNEDWVLAYHTHNPWPFRLWDIDQPYRYASSSGGAGVGYGIGGAIGVALAHRGTGRVCVDLQADGDLLYNTAALWTLAHHRLPLLIVMHNNRSYYNSEEHAERMARMRGRPVERKGIGTHIVDPAVDFAQVARGFGLWAEGPIEDPSQLRPALERALQVVKREGRAALVDVVTQPR